MCVRWDYEQERCVQHVKLVCVYVGSLGILRFLDDTPFVSGGWTVEGSMSNQLKARKETILMIDENQCPDLYGRCNCTVSTKNLMRP